MKLHRDCGLSFKAWSILIFIFELFSVGVIATLAVLTFFSKVGNESRLLYSPAPNTNYQVRNKNYEVLVTSWVVLLLLSLCTARFVAAVLLAISVKKNSAGLAQFWIAFKIFAATVSLFLVIVSFNVSVFAKTATLAALLTDLLSSYYIRLLYPELDKMRKFIKMEVDPPATAPN